MEPMPANRVGSHNLKPLEDTIALLLLIDSVSWQRDKGGIGELPMLKGHLLLLSLWREFCLRLRLLSPQRRFSQSRLNKPRHKGKGLQRLNRPRQRGLLIGSALAYRPMGVAAGFTGGSSKGRFKATMPQPIGCQNGSLSWVRDQGRGVCWPSIAGTGG